MLALDLCHAERDALFQKREAVVTRMEAIVGPIERDNRPLTKDEERDFRSVKSELGRIDVQINELDERIAELQLVQERTDARAKFPHLATGGHGGDPWERARSTTDRGELRALARGAIERTEGAPDKSRELLTRQLEAPEPGDDAVSRWAIAASDPNYRSAFSKIVGDPYTAPARMSPEELAAVQSAGDAQRAMNLGSSAQGAYLMPFELDASVLLTGDGAISTIEDYATVKFINTKTWHGISSAGVSSSWDDELEEVSSDEPTDLAQPTISVHRLSTFVPYSIEAEADVPDLVEEMARLIRDDVDVKLAAAYWTGSGTGEPKGLVTGLDAVSTSEVVLTTAGTFNLAEVYRLHEAVPPRFRQNGTWAANVAIINLIRRMGETVTGNAATIVDSLQAGNPPQLLGRPFIEASPMDATITSGASFLVFGDLSRYVIPKRPSTLEVVPHLLGTTNGRPIGARGMLAFNRVGGDLTTPAAARLLNNN